MKTQTLKVLLTFTEHVLGATPKNKEIYAKFIATKAAEKELAQEETETVQTLEEKGWTGFMQDEKGIFFYEYVLKGFFKSAGIALKDQTGLKNVKSKIDRFVFISPRRLYIKKDGKHIKTVDGVNERSLRAETMQGPRVTLARSDYISEGATLAVTINVVENKSGVDVSMLKELLDYGQFSGLGQFRNGGYGRFTWETAK